MKQNPAGIIGGAGVAGIAARLQAKAFGQGPTALPGKGIGFTVLIGAQRRFNQWWRPKIAQVRCGLSLSCGRNLGAAARQLWA